MIERNVGDIITYDSDHHRGIRVWKILAISNRTLFVEVVKHECSHMIGRDVTKDNNSHYILVQPANPNHITVSSLDYITSTTLSQEDKEIIKEYLDDKAA